MALQRLLLKNLNQKPMELQHWAHKHPLTLTEDDLFPWPCDCCQNAVKSEGARYYRCLVCSRFNLHKSCAELPQELDHPWHPDHPLTLFCRSGTFDLDFFTFNCDACGESLHRRPRYYCSRCNFYLHVDCCQLTKLNIEHAGLHHHPLTLHLKHALFSCDACDFKHRNQGLVYRCEPCQFWVHGYCVSKLTSIQNTPSHQHPLTLANSSDKSVISRFKIFCDICTMPVKQKNCVYCCRGCQFFAHVPCAINDVSPKSDPEAEYESSSKKICFPVPDEVSSIVDLLVNCQFEQMTLGSGNNGTGLKCLHDHQLTLSDSQTDGLKCLHDHQLTLSDSQTDGLCDACVRPILGGPIYSCLECRLILHKSCGELPREIHFPLHVEHKLVLVYGRDFHCTACGRLSNGFAFYCGECSYIVDIACVFLPTTIRHEAHLNHLNLNLVKAPFNWCNACRQSWGEFRFKCVNCNFNLHIDCAILPRTISHRFCKHGLTLQYSTVRIRPEEYYCEICEVEVNPQAWFYYCADCNYAFHTSCLRDYYINVKPGAIVVVGNHPHPLTLVRKPKFQPPLCSNNSGHPCIAVYFECKYCPFNLCYHCGRSGAEYAQVVSAEFATKVLSSNVVEEARNEI